jgi:hypothetical protein
MTTAGKKFSEAPDSVMERVCTGCGLTFSAKQFNWRDAAKGVRHSRCKECTKQQSKKAYQANRSYYIAYNRRLKAERRQSHLQKVWDYLLQHPCVDCGEADPVVLDFDHVGSDKTGNISYLLSTLVSWQRIEAEIRKCEVRCANCHRRKTAKEQRWYRNIDTNVNERVGTL